MIRLFSLLVAIALLVVQAAPLEDSFYVLLQREPQNDSTSPVVTSGSTRPPAYPTSSSSTVQGPHGGVSVNSQPSPSIGVYSSSNPPIPMTITNHMIPYPSLSLSQNSRSTSGVVSIYATLSSDDNTSSSFFSNPGAVAGVFSGIAVILFFLLFLGLWLCYRRRRQRALSSESASPPETTPSNEKDGPHGDTLEKAQPSTVLSHWFRGSRSGGRARISSFSSTEAAGLKDGTHSRQISNVGELIPVGATKTITNKNSSLGRQSLGTDGSHDNSIESTQSRTGSIRRLLDNQYGVSRNGATTVSDAIAAQLPPLGTRSRHSLFGDDPEILSPPRLRRGSVNAMKQSQVHYVRTTDRLAGERVIENNNGLALTLGSTNGSGKLANVSLPALGAIALVATKPKFDAARGSSTSLVSTGEKGGNSSGEGDVQSGDPALVNPFISSLDMESSVGHDDIISVSGHEHSYPSMDSGVDAIEAGREGTNDEVHFRPSMARPVSGSVSEISPDEFWNSDSGRTSIINPFLVIEELLERAEREQAVYLHHSE